jgi:hypothetical protein
MTNRPRVTYFTNPPTYFFYRWVADDAAVDTAKLVADALGRVEEDEWYQRGLDVSITAREKLAEALEALFEKEAEQFLGDLLDVYRDEAFRPNPDPQAEHLLGKLLTWAGDEINFYAVAEVLLRAAGKWAPDKGPPDAL